MTSSVGRSNSSCARPPGAFGSANPACHPWPAIRKHASAASLVLPDPPAPVIRRNAGAVPARHHACSMSRSPSRPANGTIPYSGSNRRAGWCPSRCVGAWYGGASARAVSAVTASRNRGPTPATPAALTSSSPASSTSSSSDATGAATTRSVPNRSGSTTTTPTRNGPANSAAPDIPAQGEPPARSAGAAVCTVTAHRPAFTVAAGAINPNSCSLSRLWSGRSCAQGNPTALTAICSLPSTRPQRGTGLPGGSGDMPPGRPITATSADSSRHSTEPLTQARSPSARSSQRPATSSPLATSVGERTGKPVTTCHAVSTDVSVTR